MDKEFKKKLFVNIGVLLAVVFVLGGGILFLRKDIKLLSDSIAQERSQVADRGNEISLLFDLRKELKEAELYFSILDNALPKRENLYVFNQEVLRLGHVNNLDRPSFSFGSEILSTDTLPGRAKFTIFVSGAYADILGFLRDLERSRYFIKIENFDMVERDNKFNAQLVGEVFFR